MTLNLETNRLFFAARNILKKCPEATEITIQELPQSKGGGDAGGGIILLIVIAVIVTIICFPLLVMSGMHGKLFLKGFYKDCEGEQYNEFVKQYTLIGIGLYALVAIMVLIDNIFSLYLLTGPAFGVLFFGGIAYFVGSLLLIKKKFSTGENTPKFIETLKGAFKKEKK